MAKKKKTLMSMIAELIKSSKYRKTKIGTLAVIGVLLLITAADAIGLGSVPGWEQVLEKADLILYGETEQDNDEIPLEGETVTVTVLDVGQGDSILIQTPTQNVLIDASLEEKGGVIAKDLERLGVNTLDLIVLTHPHADHIGGAVKVMQSVEVKRVLMSPQSHTTNQYENLLLEIKRQKIKSSKAKPGDIIDIGGGATLRILAPSKSFDNLNNASIISKLTYEDISFLFSGDAEKEAEELMLSRGYDIDCDIMVAGHHGSKTSTTPEYFDAASPEYVAISCGLDNDYGHPHQQTLDKLIDCVVNRTDADGSITYTTDGTSVHVQTER